MNHTVFFFNDTATTQNYTLSLHDALPISNRDPSKKPSIRKMSPPCCALTSQRPSVSTSFLKYWAGTRSEEHTSELSHSQISYAVFCLKKKKQKRSRA